MGIFDSNRDKAKKSETPKRSGPDFSDVTGGSSSKPLGESPEPAFTEYQVIKGDSLSLIAKRIYGDAQAWRKIFEANRDKIKDPDQIYPGQVLKIPSQ